MNTNIALFIPMSILAAFLAGLAVALRPAVFEAISDARKHGFAHVALLGGLCTTFAMASFVVAWLGIARSHALETGLIVILALYTLDWARNEMAYRA